MQAAQPELGATIAGVAVEICGELAGELTAHLNTVLAGEATIHSVSEAFSEHAVRGEGIETAAGRIASIIRRAREEAGVPRDSESGRRLLETFCTDPGAKLT